MAEGSFADVTLRVFRGDKEGGAPADYRVPLVPGMVVLDALHWVQAHQAPDLAVRWNCKAGKCGSCSAEVNGRPRLTCKTRMDSLPLDEPIDDLSDEDFSGDQGSGYGCFVEFQGQSEDSAFPAAAWCRVEDVSAGCGSHTGVSQVH